MEHDSEDQFSTFLTNAAVLLVQAFVIGAVGGLVATALVTVMLVSQ